MTENWTSVSKLSVVLETGEQRRETGHSYPLDKIGVVITIQPTDDDGNPVAVDPKILCDNISLVDYVDESDVRVKDSEKDKKDNKSGWRYEKSEDIAWREGRTPQIKYYVSHDGSPTPRNKSIGVLVKTGSKALVFSSLNGTYHSSVQIAEKVTS